MDTEGRLSCEPSSVQRKEPGKGEVGREVEHIWYREVGFGQKPGFAL